MQPMQSSGGEIRQIVVGVDFSAEADVATAHALAVGRKVDAKVALVHVDTIPDADEIAWTTSEARRRYLDALSASLATTRSRLEALRVKHAGQGVELSHDVVGGWPDGGLPEAAEALHADLIVVGSHGRTGIRRILLGSFAERTVRHADRSVLIARGEPVPGGYRRILVGHDFSPSSERALRLALQLAAPGADIHVVHCWNMVLPAHGYELAATGELTARVRADIAASHTARGQALVAACATSSATLHFDASESPPAYGLPAIATLEHRDLLVVGSHGRRGLRRWVMGSVAEATTRHAPCSVVVAR